jgi:hypothetical protein
LSYNVVSIMDLPNLLSKIKSTPDGGKNFLAIEISAYTVKTAVWQVQNKQTEMVSLGSIQDWESEDEDDLLSAIDTSLAEALAGLDNEPDEVIFGLPETWVSEEGIADSKKGLLKNICQKLALKAVGFVVTTEAIVHFLQDTEGGPPSAILIQITPDQVIVSLVEHGRLQGIQAVGRSEKISLDVQEGLGRFGKTDHLPNRMVLYDSKEDLEGARQDLIGFDWQTKQNFLHFPQFEILPKETTIKAVALSGGAEVAKSLGLGLAPITQTMEGEAEIAKEKMIEPFQENIMPPENMNEFGFREVEVDMSEKDETVPSPDVEHLGKEVEEIEQSSSGEIHDEQNQLEDNIEPTPVGKVDQHTTYDSQNWPKESELLEVDQNEVFGENQLQDDVMEKEVMLKQKRAKFNFRNPFKRKPKVQSWVNPPKKRRVHVPLMLMVGIVTLLLILIGGGIFYWQTPKASMTIYLRPESLDRELTFTLDPTAQEVNLETKTIPVEKKTVEMSGTDQTPTTGSKTVGERAKGQIEVFNLQREPVSLKQGTVVKNGSLAFTLNDDVSLASASAERNSQDFSVVIKPSSAKLAVTAADIGEQYNISDGSQFTVANYSQEEMGAKNVGAMTGGTARQIQAVAEEDQTRLSESLLKQLNEQIATEVNQSSAGQKGVIPASEPELVEETFSADVGEEASNLSLSATLNQEIYIYETKNVSLLGQQQVLADIPPGFEMMATATQVSVVDSEVKEDGTVEITARVGIKLLPTINTKEIAQEIKGKYPPETQEFLRKLPSYLKADVIITPELPARLNTFPRKIENISISVEGLIE